MPSSAAVSTSRGRKRDRSVDSRRSKRSRRSRSPEPERESDRVCMDRFEATLSLMKDTRLKMHARDAAREFRPVSTEVVGSSLVKTSAQPFFQPGKAVDDGRRDHPVPAGAGGVGRRERSVPFAAAGSANQLAGDGAGPTNRAGAGATNRAGDGAADGAGAVLVLPTDPIMLVMVLVGTTRGIALQQTMKSTLSRSNPLESLGSR